MTTGRGVVIGCEMSENATEEKPATTATAANVREQPAFIDEPDDEAAELVGAAANIADEPWRDEALRLRAIVFLVRSATRLREMEDAAYRERDATTLKVEEMRLMREREERREAERASEERKSAMLEAILPLVFAADADGKRVDFAAMVNSTAELKAFLDLFLKA